MIEPNPNAKDYTHHQGHNFIPIDEETRKVIWMARYLESVKFESRMKHQAPMTFTVALVPGLACSGITINGKHVFEVGMPPEVMSVTPQALHMEWRLEHDELVVAIQDTCWILKKAKPEAKPAEPTPRMLCQQEPASEPTRRDERCPVCGEKSHDYDCR